MSDISFETPVVETAPVMRHPRSLRLIHWGTAIVMAWMLASGIGFWLLGFNGLKDMLGGDVTGMIYKYHKTFGVIVLALVLLRVVVKFTRPRPVPLDDLPKAQHLIGMAVHVALYALLFAVPIIGWLATAAGGYPVQFFETNLPGLIGRDKELSGLLFTLHLCGGLAFVLLIGMHIGAALFHRFIKRDGVFGRISLP